MKAKKENAGEKEEQAERSGQTECKVISEYCNFCSFLFCFFGFIHVFCIRSIVIWDMIWSYEQLSSMFLSVSVD